MRDYEDAEVQSEHFRDRECESSSSGTVACKLCLGGRGVQSVCLGTGRCNLPPSGAVACKNACFSGRGRAKCLLQGRGRTMRLLRGRGRAKCLPGRRGFVQLPFLKQDSTAMDFVRNIMP